MGQETRVRTLYGINNWLKTEKGVHQGYILSPCLFNLYTEHITQNAGLDELQARIKIAGRNINNLRYTDDVSVADVSATLVAESEEEQKSLLMRVKEDNEKNSLKLSVKNMRITTSAPSLHGK